MSFFTLWMLKGSQSTRTAAVWVAHLEGEDTDKEECADREDPDGTEGVIDEFIIQLARAVKETQWQENAATIVAAQNISSEAIH